VGVYLAFADNKQLELSAQLTAVAPQCTYLHQTVPIPFPMVGGRYILNGLFYEKMGHNQSLVSVIKNRPIFTLKVYDYEIPESSVFYRKGELNRLKSLHQLYLEYEDPSEYNFATSVFGNFEHWKALTQTGFFREYLKEMRDVLAIKLDAKTVQAARRVMDTGVGPQALQAAKWLNQRVKENQPKPTRGRPSNDEVAGELKRQAAEQVEANDDLARLGL
jgi:hypothetical protein